MLYYINHQKKINTQNTTLKICHCTHTGKTDFLSKLQTFLGLNHTSSGNRNNWYTKANLSKCMPEYGYNVHLAGEHIITESFCSTNGTSGGGFTVIGGEKMKVGEC